MCINVLGVKIACKYNPCTVSEYVYFLDMVRCCRIPVVLVGSQQHVEILNTKEDSFIE